MNPPLSLSGSLLIRSGFSQEAGLAGVAGPDAGFSVLSPPSLSVDLLGGTHHSGSKSSDPGFLLSLLSAEVDEAVLALPLFFSRSWAAFTASAISWLASSSVLWSCT